MNRSHRPVKALLLLILFSTCGSIGKAAATDGVAIERSVFTPAATIAEPAVVTSISDLRGASEPAGGKALIAYTVRHDVNSHIDPGTPLPGARIASADHAAEFSGAYGNSVFAGVWLAPGPIIQLNPSSQLYENTYFFDQLQGIDAFGDPQGMAMEAGDHVELAMENVTADAPMTWEAVRGSNNGHLTWDVAQDSRNITASYGTLTGDMDALFVRADIVARGGDVDARTQALATDPLVIDLPKVYTPDAVGSYIITTFFPSAQYVATMRVRVEPELGKAFVEATVQGYIPAAKEYTLASGAQIKEWHLPLNLVIMIKPTGGLTGNAAITLPAGGRAVAGVGDQIKQFDLPAGGRVLAATDGTVTLPDASADSQTQGPARDAAVNQDALSAAAAINHSTSAPVDLIAGDYSVTIDPDLRGEGVLGIKSLSRLLTGTPFADMMAVPFVLIDGTPVRLERSRLVDLRVYADAPFVTIQFTGYAETTLPSRTRTLAGSAFEPGISIEAVYDLGNDRYAFAQFRAAHYDDTPAYVLPRIIVRSLTTGRRVASAPVEYVEVPSSGPITYNGATRTGEFTASLDALSPNTNLVLGQRSFTGTVFTSSTNSDGQAMVVRAPGSLAALPQPNSGLSLDGRPVALYYLQSPNSATTQSGLIYTLLGLDTDEVTPPPQPKAIDEQCAAAVIDDGSASDAPPALDVKSAWFDVDDANLYASIKVADLPAAAPAGTTYSWAMHWRIQHVTYDGRAILDSTGQFSFEFGYHNLNSAVPSYSKTADVAGDFKIGPNGIVRVWIPRSLLGLREGDLLRDTSARSLVTTNGVTVEADQAPDGSNSVQGTGGDYLLRKCGSAATVSLVSLRSRKVHGDGATFDIDLPLSGVRPTECRSGGDYTLIFRFLDRLSSVGGAEVTNGTGTISSGGIDSSDAHQYVVHLNGVKDAQTLTVSLTNVQDAAANVSPRVSGSIDFLLGDVNGNGVVTNTDVAVVKSQVAAPVTASNFRADVNANGIISNTDVSTAKAQVGASLP